MKKYKAVAEFLSDLDANKKAQVEKLREIILGLGFELVETIKWNTPSYNYMGADRITFNLLNKEGKVKLVIHMGTARKEDKKAKPILVDAPKFVNWNSDIRGTISFESTEDINAKNGDLKTILSAWLQVAV